MTKKLGCTEREVAIALGVSDRTMLDWKARHPAFLRALTPGKRAANKRVEGSLYHRALGYTHDVVRTLVYLNTHTATDSRVYVSTDTQITKQEVHYPPSEGAAKLWLTNRDEKRWKEKRVMQLQTPPGKPLEVAYVAPEAELIGAYHERLRLAAATTPDSHPRPDPGVGGDGRSGPGPGSSSRPRKG